MLKELLRNLGLLIILAGVIILGVAVFRENQSNAILGVSLVTVIAGLILHIILNKAIKS